MNTHTLYLRLPGLLARAAAHARALDGADAPLAVAEGKTVRDGSPAAVGVARGMSVLRARRLCPLLLVVALETVDPRLLSHRLYDALADLTPTIEPAGPDALFAVVGVGEEGDALARVRAAFPGLEPQGSVGPSRRVAQTQVEAGGARFVDAPARLLWPEDPAVAARLERLGLNTVGDVAAIGGDALRYQLGAKVGSLLHRRARGLDSPPVQPLWPPPAIALARHFDLEPLDDAGCLDAHLLALARDAAARLTEMRRFGRDVSLALETERGRTEASWRPPWPIQSPVEVAAAVRRLRALQPPRAPVTGLALTVAELELPPAESLSLFDAVGATGRRRLESARRLVVARYGAGALTTLGRLPLSARERRRQLARDEAQLR